MINLLWYFTPFKRQLLVHINYKSGIQEEFWVYYFWRRFEAGNYKAFKWICSTVKHPDIINIDAIESTWLVDAKGLFTLPESMEPK